VIYSKYSGRAVCILVFLPLMLAAQSAQENVVPLKNWATPLYWHPNQAEKEAVAKPAPQFQLSTNAVSTTALTFVAITPCRLVDTRGAGGGFNGDTPFSGPSLAAAATATFPVQSSTEATANTAPAPCGVIPSIAQAYSFNLTVVPHAGGAVNYVTIWPAGSPQPYVATLNDLQGLIVGNAAIVAAGTPMGGVSVFNYGPATIDVVIDMNGFFAAPTDLNGNTAIGTATLMSNTTGSDNTAIGDYALVLNTTGNYNTAIGASALFSNTTGGWNTASGLQVLYNNTTGTNNTASGFQALYDNTSGSFNTASGDQALFSNTTGMQNTADGGGALYSNTTGGFNTVSGSGAMVRNTTGGYNTVSGASALMSNTTGNDNAVNGALAVLLNTTGIDNTASGAYALENNTTGSSNIAIGFNAAINAPAANSNSIYIGSNGSASDNSGTIQIGTYGIQTGGTYISGIYGATAASGVEVYVSGNGQLGTVLSSGRFKEQITDMGDSSSKLLDLHPVNFFYKPEYDDGSHLLQYGLIAEEVAKVYPEMVAYDRDGQILTVKYQLLAPMLLNEVQKQAAQIRSLEDRLAALEALSGKVPTTAAGIRIESPNSGEIISATAGPNSSR
jgi:hypothetical protein